MITAMIFMGITMGLPNIMAERQAMAVMDLIQGSVKEPQYMILVMIKKITT